MTDLDQNNSSTQSPKKKFSFRFPHLSNSAGLERDGNLSVHQQNANYKERKNFSENIKNVPDLQVSVQFQFRLFGRTNLLMFLKWLERIQIKLIMVQIKINLIGNKFLVFNVI